MDESKSNFNPPPLRKFREEAMKQLNVSLPFQVPRIDILFSEKPNYYTTEEKKEWFEEKKKEGKPFKIGLIHSKDLDTRVNIFGEVFDFSKTANRYATNVEPDAAGTEKPEAEKPEAEKPDAEKPDAEKPDAKKPDAEKPEAAGSEAAGSEKPEADIHEALVEQGFNTSENVKEEDILPPETYYTSKDFDKMYLEWLKDAPEEKVRRSTLKQLFRFVFGKKKIKDVNKFHTKLLIAYTPLEEKEKVPCESKLRDDFYTALEFRRDNLIQEIRATKQVIGEETAYMEKKKEVLMGLRDLLNSMDEKKELCLQYGNDPSMKEDTTEPTQLQDRSATMSDSDYERLEYLSRT